MRCHVMWCRLMWSDARQWCDVVGCEVMLCDGEKKGCVLGFVQKWCAVTTEGQCRSTTTTTPCLQSATPYYSVPLRAKLNSLILDYTPLLRTTKSSPYIDIYFPYREQILGTGSIKTIFASRPPSKTALQACNLGPSCSCEENNKKIVRGTEYDFSQSRYASVFFPNRKYDPIPMSTTISTTKQYSILLFFSVFHTIIRKKICGRTRRDPFVFKFGKGQFPTT